MRRLFIFLLVFVASGVLALVTLPWWLGWAVKTGSARYGAQFSRYERIGYARFALHDVVVVQRNVRVTAARAETETPLLWLWHRVLRKPALIRVSTWNVGVSASGPSAAPSSSDSGAKRTRVILFRVADQLERWAPRVEIGEGKVSWPGGGLEIGRAQWEGRRLQVRPLRALNQAAEVDLTFTTSGEIVLEGRPTDDAPWQVALKSRGDRIDGELRLWDQIAPVTAELPARGWMPTTARVEAKAWEIPAMRLKLGDAYSVVRGAAVVEWRDERLEITADARGDVATGKSAPPIEANLHASGDVESVAVDRLNLAMPGATATLSAPVRFQRRGGLPSPDSQFDVAVDLAKLPWISGGRGNVSGRARIAAATIGVPSINANVTATDLWLDEWPVARFTGAATLEWPRLKIAEAVFGFSDGGNFSVRGGWDFKTREVLEAAAQGKLRPTAVARWLPEAVGFETVEFSATARGPLNALEHEGRVDVAALVWKALRPVAGKVSWRGQGRSVDISQAEVRAGKSAMSLAGSLTATSGEIKSFSFIYDGAERLSLTKPATVRWAPNWELAAMELAGAEATIKVSLGLGENAQATLDAKNFPSAWAEDFVTVPGPAWRMAATEAWAAWREGPVTFSVKSDVEIRLSTERTAKVKLAARGDVEGIEIEALQVSEGTAAIVNAAGRVPVSFQGKGAEKIRIDRAGALKLSATTTSNPAFWSALAGMTGFAFQNPEVKLAVAGTWEQPLGEVTATASSITADAARVKFPFLAIENLDLRATADSQGLALERLDLRVEKQVVRASGRLPFQFRQWDEFNKSPVAFLRRDGSFKLEVPDAEIAAFASRLPGFLAPVGHLQIAAEINSGGELSGSIRLRDAATRPLGPLGILQEIQADAQLSGQTIELKNLSAVTGGQPVTLTGKIKIPVDAPPAYDLALKGKNLPLVRQTGLLLRADLDLKLVTQRDDVTEVTGAVNLHDSMFLSDVRALIPRGGGGGPARRPPFFSIDAAPINAWRLGIDVRGEQFLRLRSTVFVGVASARFRLGGTLAEPRATGEASVDNGQVLLPFAAFRVEQGTVRLTEADPYALRLFMTGTSRRYGYDLRMELTGTASEPVLAFSSNPPLDAKQVWMMVTAGETPRDEVTYSGSQRVTRFGTYLGQSLINNFGGDAADADRLSIAPGERVSRQGRETYDIEYRLSDRFTLVGEYDEFDDYNAGVKWKFLPRPDTKPDATKEKKETSDGAAR